SRRIGDRSWRTGKWRGIPIGRSCSRYCVMKLTELLLSCRRHTWCQVAVICNWGCCTAVIYRRRTACIIPVYCSTTALSCLGLCCCCGLCCYKGLLLGCSGCRWLAASSGCLTSACLGCYCTASTAPIAQSGGQFGYTGILRRRTGLQSL